MKFFEAPLYKCIKCSCVAAGATEGELSKKRGGLIASMF